LDLNWIIKIAPQGRIASHSHKAVMRSSEAQAAASCRKTGLAYTFKQMA
jgi:hypothetical protein